MPQAIRASACRKNLKPLPISQSLWEWVLESGALLVTFLCDGPYSYPFIKDHKLVARATLVTRLRSQVGT
jgi:hypothetical protein